MKFNDYSYKNLMRFITSCFNVILENNEVGAENVKLRMGSEQNLLKIKYL